MAELSPEQVAAWNEVAATEKEFVAALGVFSAACLRNDAARLNRATEGVHAALQGHLDAIAANYAVARKALGL